jgi:hypothetical protein
MSADIARFIASDARKKDRFWPFSGPESVFLALIWGGNGVPGRVKGVPARSNESGGCVCFFFFFFFFGPFFFFFLFSYWHFFLIGKANDARMHFNFFLKKVWDIIFLVVACMRLIMK